MRMLHFVHPNVKVVANVRGVQAFCFRFFTVLLVCSVLYAAYDLTKGSEKPEDNHNTSFWRNNRFFNWLEVKKTRGITMTKENKEDSRLTEVK